MRLALEYTRRNTLLHLKSIPRTAVISVKSCSISHYLDGPPFGRPAQLALALGLYVEVQKGSSSQWFGYLQSLPTFVDLPIFWALDDSGGHADGQMALQWLNGTEAHKKLTEVDSHTGLQVIDDLRAYFSSFVKDVFAEHFDPPVQPDFRHFCRSFSLVSSRAFFVDTYHGLSMVPIADAFNHSSENHVHLESEYSACPTCGSLTECTHDRGLDPHSILTQVAEEESYDMVANAAIFEGGQVFNTYGEGLSNSQLLIQYGFVLEANENDSLTFEEDDLRQSALTDTSLLDEAIGLADWSFLSDSELLDISSTTYSIDCDGRLSLKMWLFFALSHCGGGRRHLPSLCTLLTNTATELHNEPPQPSTLLSATASSIIAFCRSRMSSEEDPGDSFDRLPSDMPRTRLAMTIAMGERSLLDSCIAAWEDVLATAVIQPLE